MDSEPPSQQVVTAVAREEGLAPHELASPLYDTINPEALDAIFANTRPNATPTSILFEYHGYEIEIEGTTAADITVRATAPTTSDETKSRPPH